VAAHEKCQVLSGESEEEPAIDLTKSLLTPSTLPKLAPPVVPSEGHVFILLTDLRRLSCDAWAIPTGE
jgi:hypothetical protein